MGPAIVPEETYKRATSIPPRLSSNSSFSVDRNSWARHSGEHESEIEPDRMPAWARGLSPEELARIDMWMHDHPIASTMSAILNNPRAIFVWIILLAMDMIVLLVYSSRSVRWAEVLSNIISCLFAFDVIARLILHGLATGAYSSFWRDPMNILDICLVAVDALTVIIAFVFSLPAARAAGSVKMFRSMRLARLARVSRSVRVLRMGRIMAFCGKNFDWFVYQLDNKLQTPAWKALGMFFLIMVFISLAGVIFYLMQPVALEEGLDLREYSNEELEKMSIPYSDAVWEMWSFMADPGGHADVCDRYGHTNCRTLRVYAGAIAVFGICYFAAVLGFVVDGIRDFLDELKKGTRAVIESDHIVILGFSVKSVALIAEICDSLESEGGGTIVIMDDLDKQWMEDNIAPYLPPSALRGSRIVARRGSPMVQPDLMKVSASHARALVVMAQTDVKADMADAQAVRVILALKGLSPPIRGHVVVELMDIDNRSIVELIGEPMVETVVSHDIVGRLMLLAVRNPGVNGVYDEVFGFQNDEFYIKEWPELEGLTFETITLMMPDAVVLGFRRANRKRHGKHRSYEQENDPDWVHTREGRFQKYGIEINPKRDAVLEPGDGILVLAADDDSYHPTEEAFVLGSQPKVELPTRRQKPDRTLVCGWRRDIDDMIVSLDAEVEAGSEVHILSELPVEEREDRLRKGSMTELKNLTLHHHLGNSAVRRVLEELNLASFHYVLILADEEREDRPLDSDAHNLATLLLLRDLRHRQGLANSRQLLEVSEAQKRKHHRKRSASPFEKKMSMKGGGGSGDRTFMDGVTGAFREVVTGGGGKKRRSGSIRATSPHVGSAGRFWSGSSGGGSDDSGQGGRPPSPPSGSAAAAAETRKIHYVPEPAHAPFATAGLMSPVAVPQLLASSPSEMSITSVSPEPSNQKAPVTFAVDSSPSAAAAGAAAAAGSGGKDASSALTPEEKREAKHRRAVERKAERKAAEAAAAAVSHAEMCMIAVEILDSRTKSTLQSEPSIRAAADYLLSHTTMSKVLAMILMQRDLKGVLEELLSEEGQSFFVHQATRFTEKNELCSFWDVASRAMSCGEVLVGYRPTSSGTTIINPSKKHEPRVWAEFDLLVVCCDTAAMMTPAALNYKRLKRYWRNSLLVRKGSEGSAKLSKRNSFSEMVVAAAGGEEGEEGEEEEGESKWGGPEFVTSMNAMSAQRPRPNSGGDSHAAYESRGDERSTPSPFEQEHKDAARSGSISSNSGVGGIRESRESQNEVDSLVTQRMGADGTGFNDQVINLRLNDAGGRFRPDGVHATDSKSCDEEDYSVDAPMEAVHGEAEEIASAASSREDRSSGGGKTSKRQLARQTKKEEAAEATVAAVLPPSPKAVEAAAPAPSLAPILPPSSTSPLLREPANSAARLSPLLNGATPQKTEQEEVRVLSKTGLSASPSELYI